MRRSKRLATHTSRFGPVPTSFRFFDQGEWDTFNELVRRELAVHGLHRRVQRSRRSDAARPCKSPSASSTSPSNAAAPTMSTGRRSSPITSRASPASTRCRRTRHAVLPALRVLLVPDDYLPTDIATLHVPYAESVIATVVADLPSSVRSLAPTDLDRLGHERGRDLGTRVGEHPPPPRADRCRHRRDRRRSDDRRARRTLLHRQPRALARGPRRAGRTRSARWSPCLAAARCSCMSYAMPTS